jgi:type I restriction enzyme S subunit
MLGDMFRFSGGLSASRAQLSSDGYCYLHYGDIHCSTKTFVDVCVDYQNIPKLDIPLRRVPTHSLINDGDIVFVDASEDDEGASKHVVVINKKNVPFIAGLHTIVAKSTTEELIHEYRRYCFQTAAIRHQFLYYAVGTKVVGISKSNIPKLLIAVPTIPEQRAIATALSDMEALLGGLDRLIAKKRNLKLATMQQLLTGQTRLPGFHDEWGVKRLGDYVAFLRNGVNSRAELLSEGRVKYLHYGDIHASKETYLSPESLPAIPDAMATRLDRLQDGDLVFADASEDLLGVSKSVEMKGIGTIEVVPGQHTIAARFDKTVLADGFKGFLQFCPPFATHLRRLAAGTKVYATNRAYISSVEMRLPSVPEQSAIAAVLSDMDAELVALEVRLAKTRHLKQAMMQELLTGRTRLL